MYDISKALELSGATDLEFSYCNSTGLFAFFRFKGYLYGSTVSNNKELIDLATEYKNKYQEYKERTHD